MAGSLGEARRRILRASLISTALIFWGAHCPVGRMLYVRWKSELPLEQARDAVPPAIGTPAAGTSRSSHGHVLSAGAGVRLGKNTEVDTCCLCLLSIAVLRHWPEAA